MATHTPTRSSLAFLICSGQTGAMHPPRFHPHHTIGDWPDCHLEVRCPTCGKMVIVALRMFRLDYGGARVLDLVSKLTCRACGVKPAPVFLCAGTTRSFTGGPAADWAIELVPPPTAPS